MFSLSKKNPNYYIAHFPYGYFFLKNAGEKVEVYEFCSMNELDNAATLEGGTKLLQFIDMVEFYQIKKGNVFFNVDEESLFVRTVELPTDGQYKTLKEYVEMELNHTIQLPYERVLYDVYYANEEQTIATLFVSPEEVVMKEATMIEEVGLEPVVADIQALNNYRYLETLDKVGTDVVLIINWSFSGVSSAIFKEDVMKFHRFQPWEDWEKRWELVTEKEEKQCVVQCVDEVEEEIAMIDIISEITKLMQFYNYSVNKEDAFIERILLIGGHPMEELVLQKLNDVMDLPIDHVTEEEHKAEYPEIPRHFAPLIGLMLREETE